jgi:hypothetical protein
MFVKEHVDKAMSPPVFQCSLSKAAIDPHAELFIASHARSHPSEPVVSYHQLLRVMESYQVLGGDVVAPVESELVFKKIKKAANKAGNSIKKTANKAGSSIKKTANKAADGIKKLNPMKLLDGLLKKAQLPTFKELVGIVKCVVPVGKGLKKLLGRPSLSQANSVFKTMDGCMCKLDRLSQQCEGPAVMLVSTQDPVGQVVGYVCAMAAKAVSKYVSLPLNENSFSVSFLWHQQVHRHPRRDSARHLSCVLGQQGGQSCVVILQVQRERNPKIKSTVHSKITI